jgi:hypothetical protein
MSKEEEEEGQEDGDKEEQEKTLRIRQLLKAGCMVVRIW